MFATLFRDKIYNKIRNLKYRYLQEGTLFPEEMTQYEPYSIHEAIKEHGSMTRHEIDELLWNKLPEHCNL